MDQDDPFGLIAVPGPFGQELGKLNPLGPAKPGSLVTTGTVQPKGTRLRLANGKISVTDGPFIELKELTGGFAVIDDKSLDEAIEWCKRFRKIVGDGETEIVQVVTGTDGVSG